MKIRGGEETLEINIRVKMKIIIIMFRKVFKEFQKLSVNFNNLKVYTLVLSNIKILLFFQYLWKLKIKFYIRSFNT